MRHCVRGGVFNRWEDEVMTMGRNPERCIRTALFAVVALVALLGAETAFAGDVTAVPTGTAATETPTDTPTATPTDTPTATPTDTPTATATATATDTATVAATATPSFCTGLDVDENGVVQAATDGVYIFRRLLGLATTVPTSFRDLDDSILDDASINANIDGLGAGLDVDENGQTQGQTDGVYIFRDLLNLLTVVPTSFRTLDPTIPPDNTISANIEALCSGGD